MKFRPFRVGLVAAVLFLAAPRMHAQDGAEGAISQANLTPPARLALPFQQTLAVADLDGDNKPDGAVLVDQGSLSPQGRLRTVALHFTGRGNANLTFESNETALGISTQDVNHDGATDIVVEQPLTHKRLNVWLNDGHGNFQKVRSEDYPAPQSANHGQELSSQRTDSPAVCLPMQRGSEFATLTGCASLRITASRDALHVSGAIRVSPRAIALNSSRAPPVSL